MHPGISTPGDDQLYRLPQDGAQRTGERPLDGAEARLGSPAGEPRSVVLHEPGELQNSWSVVGLQLAGGKPYPAKITAPPPKRPVS